MRILIALMLVMCLTSCATHTYYYKEGKLVAYVKQENAGAYSFDDGTLKFSGDTRQQSWWERNVLPFMTGALNRASGIAEVGVD